MRNLFLLTAICLLFLFSGCSSKYTYQKSDMNFESSQKYSKEEAFKKFAELIVKYKSEEKAHFVSFNTGFFKENVEDLKEALNTKYKFNKIFQKDNKIQSLYVDKNCGDNSCMKGFFFEIDTKRPVTVCKVKKIHKETKEETLYYDLSSLSLFIGFYDPKLKKISIAYILFGLKLEEKEKMDEILGLLKNIYNPQFLCK